MSYNKQIEQAKIEGMELAIQAIQSEVEEMKRRGFKHHRGSLGIAKDLINNDISRRKYLNTQAERDMKRTSDAAEADREKRRSCSHSRGEDAFVEGKKIVRCENCGERLTA